MTATTIQTEEQATLRRGTIGESIPRKEDRRLVQGQGVFVDDVKRHDMGYVHFVRSPYAHAKIVRVDVSDALALPGVYGTLTGDEVGILTDPFFEMSTPPGDKMREYALAVGKVRHTGEPVVAVCAKSRELARDAADLVEVEYEALPAVLDSSRAASPRTRRFSTTKSAGTSSGHGVYDYGDVERAFAGGRPRRRVERLHFAASRRRRWSARVRWSSRTPARALSRSSPTTRCPTSARS